MDKHDTKIVDLVNSTGVSRDVINKLISRENSSTTAENAILIAAHYGKSIEKFTMLQENDKAVPAIFDLLLPEEVELLEAQAKVLLSRRAQQ